MLRPNIENKLLKVSLLASRPESASRGEGGRVGGGGVRGGKEVRSPPPRPPLAPNPPPGTPMTIPKVSSEMQSSPRTRSRHRKPSPFATAGVPSCKSTPVPLRTPVSTNHQYLAIPVVLAHPPLAFRSSGLRPELRNPRKVCVKTAGIAKYSFV